MKQKDVLKEEEKELKDIKNFHYQQGSICRLEPWGDKDEKEEIIERLENKRCPRCEGPLEERPDGKLYCPADGLILTDELRKRFGI